VPFASMQRCVLYSPPLVRRGSATTPATNPCATASSPPIPSQLPLPLRPSHKLPLFFSSSLHAADHGCRQPPAPPVHRCRVLAIWSCRAMASVAATTTLAPALAPRRRARPGTGLLPPRRASAVRCSLDSNVSDMGVNGEERDPFYS
jgi:hypothetical protein